MIVVTNVMVLPLAASDSRRVFSLAGRSNTHLVAAREATRGGGRFVQAVPLDDVLGDLPRLDVVKMDIEGHEPPALRGLARLLARHRPGLLVEFNPECLDVQAQDPLELLRQVFDVQPRVRALSHVGDDETFASPESVLAFWTRRSSELAAQGTLADGTLHFDLVAARAKQP